jgi:hypothetical protein
MSNNFDLDFERCERTNILPLRWFANGIEAPAHWFLVQGLRMDEAGYTNNPWFWFCGKMWTMLYKPVLKWGTYYTMKDWHK